MKRSRPRRRNAWKADLAKKPSKSSVRFVDQLYRAPQPEQTSTAPTSNFFDELEADLERP